MEPAWIVSLYDYNAWANRHLLDLAERVEPAKLTQPIGMSFGSILDTLSHVCNAEGIWLSRWHGDSPRVAPKVGGLGLAELRERLTARDQEIRTFVGGLTRAELDQPRDYTDFQGRSFTTPIWQLLLHVINHGTHHRSEASTMLTDLGTPPPPLDLIAFFRERA